MRSHRWRSIQSCLPESADGSPELVKYALLVEVDGMRRNTMDIEAPRSWTLQPNSCTVRYTRGSDSVGWSQLHTAGPDNSGRVIRLQDLQPFFARDLPGARAIP
jgi:hypothetical protein